MGFHYMGILYSIYFSWQFAVFKLLSFHLMRKKDRWLSLKAVGLSISCKAQGHSYHEALLLNFRFLLASSVLCPFGGFCLSLQTCDFIIVGKMPPSLSQRVFSII